MSISQKDMVAHFVVFQLHVIFAFFSVVGNMAMIVFNQQCLCVCNM